MNTDKRMFIVSNITQRILETTKVDNPRFAGEIARKWLKFNISR